MPSPTGTQAVDRAALLLSTVVRADEPVTFAELTDATGLAKSTTSRLLIRAGAHRAARARRRRPSTSPGQLFSLYAARHDPRPS